jgi:hypothetical protein
MTSSKSPTSSAEVPIEFAELMNQEPALDRGALLRLWRTTHEILPDATAEEIRHFFHDRAVNVYRNRRLENPTGLMLSTIHDWFEPRRVTERRRAIQQAAATFEVIRAELCEMGIVVPAQNNEESASREPVQDISDQIAEAANRRGLR